MLRNCSESSDSSMNQSDDDYIPKSSEENSPDCSSDSLSAHMSDKIDKDEKSSASCSTYNRPVPDSTVSDSESKEYDPVSVKAVSVKTGGGRVYDKKQFCLFCGKSYAKIARHIEQIHHNETEVAKALQFPRKSKERRLQIDLLRNRGNFAHNVEVLKMGKGMLIPRRQPRNCLPSKDFAHCLNCQGFFLRHNLWRHMKHCKLRKRDQPKPGKNRVQSLCAFAEPVPPGVDSGLWKLMSEMIKDDISLIVKKDPCILQIARHLFNRLGSDISKHEYIRQKIRELGRLLLCARRITPLQNMKDFIIPSSFPHVVTAVKCVAGYDQESGTMKTPSLALKLGHSLQKISNIVEAQAMVEENEMMVKNAQSFRKIYETQWNELISSVALRCLRESKWNAPQLLPFTEDVKKMHLYLDDKQEENYKNLLAEASARNWASLAKVTLTQIILFNRKREGEVSRMLLNTFLLRDVSDLHGDVALALSELEQKLCHHFIRIEIKGKRGRKVPILLSPAMHRAMKLLAEKRDVCGVPCDNNYMFARPSALSHFRGSDCIRLFAKECGAKSPKTLSSTKLRKHVATLSKVLNLNDTELDQLADFLGHDIRVHRQYYRLPEGTLQLAKISKILLALETGRLGEFKGKNLDDITIDPTEKVVIENETSESEEELSDHEGEAEMQVKQMKRAQGQVQETKVNSVCQGHKQVKRRMWSEEEIRAVEKHLAKFINICKVPGKGECEACIQNEPQALKNRDWLSVKFFIKNRITSLKRKV
ncbi:uncharacterized protein LOC114648939 [Erpetoichthys calabaricus]|uniref:uncharacterized protein LOC114648939 n=1 Tax=Erpetoichthys calabaricus TaxID=27687 RepID=UPI002234B599|nr:uncharacterized protein LOC114648939 [Erpetoichthys calabaricus]